MSAAETPLFSKRGLVLAGLAAVLLAVIWIATLPAGPAYGWDESMHVALPAERMRIALAEGRIGLAFDAMLDCAQYPFVQPVLLALVQSIFGATERVARALGIVEWCATIFGVFVLARLVIESMTPERRPRAAWIAPWLALALAALSPLALGFAGTLFLEIPSASASVWALVAWLWLWREPTRKRALVTGALVTLALFTKWNYGLLLGAGLAIDLVLRFLEREGRSERVRLLLPLAAVPLVACAWWFVLPLPGGGDVAAEHRSAFASFLSGNQDLTRTTTATRTFYATCLLASPPRLALLIVAGFVTALMAWRARSVRTLIVVFLAAWLPVWIHPFFQERFLVPGAVCAWVLAAIGVSRWLAAKPLTATVTAAAIVCASAWPVRSEPPLSADTYLVGDALGIFQRSNPDLFAYQSRVLAERQALLSDRSLPIDGLDPLTAKRILDAVAEETGRTERVGWIGVSSVLSPAVLHLGLLVRDGSRARFLREAEARLDLDYFADPHVDAAGVRAYAENFDVIFATDPPDLKDHPKRAWAKNAREMLVQDGAWVAREIGRFEIARPLQQPLVVTLFACRRKK